MPLSKKNKLIVEAELKRQKEKAISSAVSARKKMNRLREMYGHQNRWMHRHMHKSMNQVNNEYNEYTARRNKAARMLQRFFKNILAVEKAKRLSPKNRTINNPLWVHFVGIQMKRTR